MKNFKTLLDIQIGTSSQIEEIYTEEDLIKLSISLMTIHLARLIPILSINALSPKKSRKRNPKDFIDNLTEVLRSLLVLCNSCNYDIPEDADIEEFEKTIPSEVKNDSILTVLGMLGSVSELAHAIYVDTLGLIWEQEELPEDFDVNVSTILVGIKNIGIKNGFNLNDILVNLD